METKISSDIIERTEKDLMDFYRDTMVWPVGKDMPKSMTPPDERTIRIQYFEYWFDTRYRTACLKNTNKRLLETQAKLRQALGMAKIALEHNNIDESMAGEFEIITDALNTI